MIGKEHRQPVLDVSKLRQFDFQVAGHPGLLEVEGGGMLIKPLGYEKELVFYEKVESHCPALRPFLPVFYGTLEHATDSEQNGSCKKKYICIENAVSGFRSPCVIDIKIGAQIWDDDMTPEKRERMMKRAQARTSGKLGIAVSGMRIHGQAAMDREWCNGLTDTTIINTFGAYFAPAEENVSPEYRRHIIQQFIKEITELRAVIASTETRMYASSLLLVYEASRERHDQLDTRASMADPANRHDSEDGDSDNDDDGALLDMKAIDFAHSQWVPGQGRDENYLAGISKLIELLALCLQKNSWQSDKERVEETLVDGK
ncbi:hypothetical protein GGI25_001184 [Coemansia spiralis]|uniref:Kinase n=2 Tax=Coemansia TaxID=4863 RepID=A0A9W8KZM8_9FUNG|nr:hypothetical protein BX070DRAFT_220750 [Coemansia spiralis]KAJ1986875.1 hypothetical protein EDC05_006118 [Coemansia umbellata]KAJ2624681.1 hypothetical protein GGI26_001375 [Coemansia sp. RSA 1358]KAJ2679733.1 hypothetical protein GGI25_001184 [Coemansia spiralis]